jgi:hypothetical protein
MPIPNPRQKSVMYFFFFWGGGGGGSWFFWSKLKPNWVLGIFPFVNFFSLEASSTFQISLTHSLTHWVSNDEELGDTS